MSDMMGSLSDRQSGIIDYTTNMRQSVNDVQTKADTLNNNWGKMSPQRNSSAMTYTAYWEIH